MPILSWLTRDEDICAAGRVPYRAFPAHAGMNRHSCGCCAQGNCVPRTRGDEPATARAEYKRAVRSPHTRG